MITLLGCWPFSGPSISDGSTDQRGTGQQAAAAELSASLTAATVRRLASAMDIPMTGSEDVQQVLDAKLSERSHEPMKAQVVVCMGADSVTLCLEDAEGTFLEIQPENKSLPDEEEDTHSEEDLEKSLQQSLQSACSRNQELTEELHQLGRT